MTGTPGRKAKPEEYAYSWFMPAPGSDQSKQQMAPDGPSPDASSPQEEGPHEEAAVVSATPAGQPHERAEHSGSMTGKLKGMSITQMRIAGLGGWGAVAATGAALLLMESSPSLEVHLGALSGVWMAVSLAIWFLPSKL
jgi:hypothetical protein